ncbi:metallophosphoesterase family protein [Anaerobutyricum hallii]|uniref:metallophosphoesterase family protein n=1 Tax=Anaerobutyricum hallii TaxID=39488 RepID=UPI00242A987F|nr:metallophosphoesterase [Anaerobutyricum hallii]
MNDFTILHLSDLHIEPIRKKNILMENLLKDIADEMKYSNDILVVVTGDIVNKSNYEAKKEVIDFFQKLKNILGSKVKHIYIVPGNHDKKRSHMDQTILSLYGNTEKPEEEDEWKYIRVSFDEYIELVREIYGIFYKREEVEARVLPNTYGVQIDEVNGKRICILQFNTAWTCTGDKDQRHLKIGKYQMDQIKKMYLDKYTKLEKNKEIDITIALAHHPVSWLTGEEEDRIQDEILSNNGLNANVYVCGHTHNRDVINWQNNRHSLTTLVSGIGWPDDDWQHPYAHNYSSYVFNLDVNSIDVYVRSSDDAYVFEPDFRIYTNARNKENKKIIMPIDICKTQAYFNLGAPGSRSAKSCYITEDLIREISRYVRILVMCENEIDKRYESIQQELIIGENEESSEKRSIEIRKEFSVYLTAICKVLCNTISEEKDVKLRTHFRIWKETTDLYVPVVFWTNYEKAREHEMSIRTWGELLEESYKKKVPLIASVNQMYCQNSMQMNKSNEKGAQWVDFITCIPQCPKIGFIELDERTQKVKKERPYLTFGVTVYDEKDRDILYILDYLRIDWFIGRQIAKFFKRFSIDLKQYADSIPTTKKGRKENE